MIWKENLLFSFGRSLKESGWSNFKMNFRPKTIVFGVVSYTILITAFFCLKVKNEMILECYINEPCVRFCCKDASLCTEPFIRANFNFSLVPRTTWLFDFEDFNTTTVIEILNGPPRCSLRPYQNENPWEFGHVRRFLKISWEMKIDKCIVIFQGGSVDIKDEELTYDHHDYCLQEFQTESGYEWNLMLCKHNKDLREIANSVCKCVAEI